MLSKATITSTTPVNIQQEQQEGQHPSSRPPPDDGDDFNLDLGEDRTGDVSYEDDKNTIDSYSCYHENGRP